MQVLPLLFQLKKAVYWKHIIFTIIWLIAVFSSPRIWAASQTLKIIIEPTVRHALTETLSIVGPYDERGRPCQLRTYKQSIQYLKIYVYAEKLPDGEEKLLGIGPFKSEYTRTESYHPIYDNGRLTQILDEVRTFPPTLDPKEITVDLEEGEYLIKIKLDKGLALRGFAIAWEAINKKEYRVQIPSEMPNVILLEGIVECDSPYDLLGPPCTYHLTDK